MIKKIILYSLLIVFVACGSSKSTVVRTTKSNTQKPVVRTVRKPVSKPVNTSVVKQDASSKVESQKPVEAKNSNEIEVVQNQEIEILEATTQVKVTTAMVLEYIDKYKSIAKQDMIEYGIPASIILGQGILESGAGTGPLSTKANNHFGIKCHKEWTGPSVRYDDDEEQECFRKYNNPDESYRDHSLFLITRERYSSLFKLDKSDYQSWARGLKNAGYATDQSYPTKLIGLIERYQLQQFDAEVLGLPFTPTSKIQITKPLDVIQNSVTDTNSSFHKVTKGDTLYSISKKYNISIEDLKKKNNILNDSLSIGQTLIIK